MGSTQKKLSLKTRFAFAALQGIHAVAQGVQLTSAGCAGERNGWADDLSRGSIAGFNPARRVDSDLAGILSKPWASHGHSWVGLWYSGCVFETAWRLALLFWYKHNTTAEPA